MNPGDKMKVMQKEMSKMKKHKIPNKMIMSNKTMEGTKMKVMSKSIVAKKARKGSDMGKKGKGFSKAVKMMTAKGMPMANAKRIMGSQMQKMRKKGIL